MGAERAMPNRSRRIGAHNATRTPQGSPSACGRRACSSSAAATPHDVAGRHPETEVVDLDTVPDDFEDGREQRNAVGEDDVCALGVGERRDRRAEAPRVVGEHHQPMSAARSRSRLESSRGRGRR